MIKHYCLFLCQVINITFRFGFFTFFLEAFSSSCCILSFTFDFRLSIFDFSRLALILTYIHSNFFFTTAP